MNKLHFEQTPLRGALVVVPLPYSDERGQMIRTFCLREFASSGIDFTICQTNASINHRAGTLRGMHYQETPAAEAKIVRCVRGSVYDVVIDLQPDSPTYLQHFGIELSAENMKMLYIPEHYAHGFLTLEDNTELHYLVDNFYTPEYSRGYRYDDPVFNIDWPRPVECISSQDLNWPLITGEIAC